MIQKPLAAAIVTCKNQGRYLRACLDSLLSQTVPFLQIVLVDDGSADETFSIWENHYQDKVHYERVSFGNQMAARDAGIRLVKAPLITCVDADDWTAAEYHEKLAEPFESDPLMGIVYSGQELVLEDDSAWFPGKSIRRVPFDLHRFWKTNVLAGASLFRRELWPEEGHRDFGVRLPDGTAFAEDWDFWLFCVSRGWKAKLVPEPLWYYRIHGSNTSRQVVEQETFRQTALWEIREKHVFYDLTMFVFLNEAGYSAEEIEAKLRRFKKQKNCQIVIVSGISSGSGNQKLKSLAAHYFEIEKLPHATPLQWKAYAIRNLAFLAASREVLIMDFRELWPDDLYVKLHELRVSKKAQIVSTAAPERENVQAVARRIRKGAMDYEFLAVPRGCRRCRVFSGPMDAFLMDMKTFHEYSFAVFQNSLQFEHEELSLGYWVWEKNKRWFWLDDVIPEKQLVSILQAPPLPARKEPAVENKPRKSVNQEFPDVFVYRKFLNRWKWTKRINSGVNSKSLKFQRSERISDAEIFFNPHAENTFILTALFEEIDESIDLEAYCEAARISEWPVVICGPVEISFLPRLISAIEKTPNLYLWASAIANEGWKALEPFTGAVLCLVKNSFRPESLPQALDFLHGYWDAGLPLIYKNFSQVSSEREEDFIETALQIRSYQQIPRWTRAMMGG